MKRFTLVEADAYTAELDVQYRTRLHRHILTLMGGRKNEEAEDIVQNTFLKICTTVRIRRCPFDYPYQFIRIVAENLYKAECQHRSVTLLSEKEDASEILDDRDQPDVVYELREQVENVTEQIKAIPKEAVRATMELLSEGRDVDEIARRLHQSPKTTRNNIGQGRAHLRRHFSDDNLPKEKNHER